MAAVPFRRRILDLKIMRLKGRTVLYSIADEATLQWEKYPRLHNLTDDEIASLIVREFDAHEDRRMEITLDGLQKNWLIVWMGAPVFNKYIHTFVTEKPSDGFLFNRKYLKEFNRKSGNACKRGSWPPLCNKNNEFHFTTLYNKGTLYEIH